MGAFGSISLEANTVRAGYAPWEDIELDLTITNESARKIKVRGPSGHDHDQNRRQARAQANKLAAGGSSREKRVGSVHICVSTMRRRGGEAG